MLFNSIDFAIFLPIVFLLYWFVFNRNLRLQNALILVSSYFFYGWWDWRFLSLIAFSTIVDYVVGLKLKNENDRPKRKILLWISVSVNIGFLGFFKYYNFFVDSFVDAFTFFGHPISSGRLDLILPVGISFYTFQTLSYTIDVYKRKLEPTNSLIDFSAFVSFFPQLVAGPIERASNLLPQFYVKRNFDYEKAVDGLRQMLWGFFKKVVVADSAAIVVNQIFNSTDDHSGSTYIVAIYFFAIQIYGDFSGYSDIAIGASRLFGFNLMRNFAYPFFARDISEFWQRWHISLTTWFRDYIYFPLGGSRGSKWLNIRNTLIVFIVSGLWHGANWTFVTFGFISGAYFIPLILSNSKKKRTEIVAQGKMFPTPKEFFSIVLTVSLWTWSCIFFRAINMKHAINIYSEVFSKSLFTMPEIFPKKTIVLIFVLLIMEWFARENQHALEKLGTKWVRPARWAMYFVIFAIVVWFSDNKQEFIYFQF
jgi:alginate O-acetyltransferase complex protein AlgI